MSRSCRTPLSRHVVLRARCPSYRRDRGEGFALQLLDLLRRDPGVVIDVLADALADQSLEDVRGDRVHLRARGGTEVVDEALVPAVAALRAPCGQPPCRHLLGVDPDMRDMHIRAEAAQLR